MRDMPSGPAGGQFRFLVGCPRVAWTDYERIKWLRRAIAEASIHLQMLRCDQAENRDVIFLEEARLTFYSRQLQRIQSKVLVA